MKKIKTMAVVAVAAFFISGCASVKSPLTGFWYTNVKTPITATGNSNSTKVGSAQAVSVLGIVATGDASIEAAAKSSGITKIHHVDAESTSILGFFAKYKIYVYGE